MVAAAVVVVAEVDGDDDDDGDERIAVETVAKPTYDASLCKCDCL